MDLNKLNNMFKTETTFRDIMGNKIQIYDIICFLPRKRNSFYNSYHDNKSLKVGIVKEIAKNLIKCHSINKDDKTVYTISTEYSDNNVIIINEKFNKEEINSFKMMSEEKDQKIKKEREDNIKTYILFAFEHKTENKFGFYISFNQGKYTKDVFLKQVANLQKTYKNYNIYPYIKYENNIEGFFTKNITDIKFNKIRKFSNFINMGLDDDLSECFIEIEKHNYELKFKYSKENIRTLQERFPNFSYLYFDQDNYLNNEQDVSEHKWCIFKDYKLFKSISPLNKEDIIHTFKYFLNDINK